MNDATEQSAVPIDGQATPAAKRVKTAHYVFAGILLALALATAIWVMRSSGLLWSAIPLAACALYVAALLLLKKAWQEEADEDKLHRLRVTGLCALIASFLSAALLLIFSEAGHLDNTLDGMNLFRLYFILGAGVGAMLGARLARMLMVKKIFVIKTFLISFALFAIAGASQLNRQADDADEKRIDLMVLEKESAESGLMSLLAGGEPARFIYVLYEEDEERLILPKLLWNTVIPKDTVKLTVREGFLGYPYITTLNGHPLH